MTIKINSADRYVIQRIAQGERVACRNGLYVHSNAFGSKSVIAKKKKIISRRSLSNLNGLIPYSCKWSIFCTTALVLTLLPTQLSRGSRILSRDSCTGAFTHQHKEYLDYMVRCDAICRVRRPAQRTLGSRKCPYSLVPCTHCAWGFCDQFAWQRTSRLHTWINE